MKNKENLKYRMYGFVPYNISPIQAGIQFGHAVVEYGLMAKDIPEIEEIYNEWANNDKTFIILNGGTTNNNEDSEFYGTINQYRDELINNGVLLAQFHEPDLGNQLTALVFLVDERVFDDEQYPDFSIELSFNLSTEALEHNHKMFVDSIGGQTNLFLREFLRSKKLANN